MSFKLVFMIDCFRKGIQGEKRSWRREKSGNQALCVATWKPLCDLMYQENVTVSCFIFIWVKVECLKKISRRVGSHFLFGWLFIAYKFFRSRDDWISLWLFSTPFFQLSSAFVNDIFGSDIEHTQKAFHRLLKWKPLNKS